MICKTEICENNVSKPVYGSKNAFLLIFQIRFSASPRNSSPINVSAIDPVIPDSNAPSSTFLAWSASADGEEEEHLAAHWWPYPRSSQSSDDSTYDSVNSQNQLARRHSTMEWSQLYSYREDQAEKLLSQKHNDRKCRSSSEGNGERVRRIIEDRRNNSLLSCSIPEEQSEDPLTE